MPWNEPGKNNSGNQDPWGSGRRSGGGSSNPLDLEKWLRRLIDRLRTGGDGGGSPAPAILLAAAVAIVAWLASGFYIVGPGERGVVLRFGAYTETSMPGPHWHLPYPVEQVHVVDIDQNRSAQSKAVMLTQDENIVDVDVSAQYRVKNAEEYLFNVRDPNQTLRDVLISAIREIVGKSKMDYVVGEGRADIALRTQALMQHILDGYKIGLEVIKVNLQDAQPPEQVQSAFADAIKAREDEVRYRNEAEAYANTVIPQARGKAARELEEAEGYKQQVVARAQGDASRFDQLLKEYEKAPKVTRERLYLDTMQSVLSNSSKVLIDSKGKNILYLPIDNLTKGASQGGDAQNPAAIASSAAAADADPMQAERMRRDLRNREAR
ncbi:FtsH protease activity modulator HflK [Acidihalobacter prosperus]|uniref:Protein HflK n=1 Tax=Acidihalobacter prosperus TaxID=160660 RepID=A0A1A6C2N1_9GAMM|nr:FtsH protease activity modulator HflK [Acidihalobacter prosperus]OBS08805.1 HflK protein [Acidihalobacter prosperus]